MKIGFIGIGSMATAIISGMSDKENIFISTRTNQKTLEQALILDVNATKSNSDCAKIADILFICVKPEQIESVSNEIKAYTKGKTIVSIAAKMPIRKLESYFGQEAIIRVMPNLNVHIKKGTSALCHNNLVSDEALEKVRNIFKNLGDLEEIEESLFSAFIGIAGSAPAFIFKFIDALIQEAIKEGMNPEKALEIAVSTVKGSAQYLLESEDDAQTLIKKVCSPNGTTIEGVESLDKDEFDVIVQRAVHKTIRKDKTEA